MSPAAIDLLGEVHRRGAIAYRLGDRIRVRPGRALPGALVEQLHRHVQELLPLVPALDDGMILLPGTGTWRLVVKSRSSPPPPVHLDDGSLVVDLDAVVHHDLHRLRRLLDQRHEGRLDLAHQDSVDMLLDRLRRCGCDARVEPVA